MAIINRKSVGAGKDLISLAAAANYITGRDLVALDEIVIFEVYENLSSAHITFQPGNSDKDHYCLIQPAKGLSWKELRSSNDPVDYEGQGIELTLLNVGLMYGMKIRGFMIKHSGTTNYPAIKISRSDPVITPVEIAGCILLATAGFSNNVAVIETSGGSPDIYDCVFFIAAKGYGIYTQSASGIIGRNTFIKRAGSTAAYAIRMASYSATIKDCVFVGFGAEPISGTNLGPRTNNYSDMAGTGASSPVIVVTGTNALTRAINDARPTIGSPIIGASSTGANMVDARGVYRGTPADVGAIEAVAAPAPAVPTLAVTNITVDTVARKVVIVGTVTGSPIFGTAVITNTASTSRYEQVVTFGATDNKFSATFLNVPIDSYKAPVIVAENYGGVGAPATNATSFEVTAPPRAIGTITNTRIYGRSITVSGTFTGAADSGTISIAPAATSNGAVAKSDVAITISGNTFTGTINGVVPGNYAAPIVILTNASGNSNPASDGAAFVITPVVVPMAVITNQVRIGNKLIIMGTFTKYPDTATLTLTANSTSSNPGTTTATVNVTLDKIAGTFDVALPNIAQGDYNAPTLTFTNEAGSGIATGGTALSMLPDIPTPIPGVTICTIGTGREYSTLASFATWLRTQDLVALNQSIYAYVYEDIVDPSLRLGVANANDTCRCVIMPAPGYGVWEIEDSTGPVGYGKYGIELTLSINRGLWVGTGIEFSGFRIRVPASNGATGGITADAAFYSTRYLQPSTNTYQGGFFRRNRVLVENTSVVPFIAMGYTSPTSLRVEDNVFFHRGNGMIMNASETSAFNRNTVIRLSGAAADITALASSSANFRANDNAFVGYGSNVIVPTVSKGGVYANNYSSSVLDPAVVGVTVDTVKPFIVSDSDARPFANGALIGKGSIDTISVNDVRYRNRGAAPDVGAVQLQYVMPLPYGTITSQVVNAQRVTIKGTTNNSPTAVTVTIPVGATPAGAIQQGPIEFPVSGNDFTVVINDVPPGNYLPPVVKLINAGGTGNAMTGTVPIVIQLISGNPQAVMEKPAITIDNVGLANGVITATGTVDYHGDVDGAIAVYLDPILTGPTLGPFVPVTTNNAWTFISGPGVLGGYKLRAVATIGDGQSTTVIGDQISSTLISSGVISLPRHGQTTVAPPSLKMRPVTRLDATTQAEYDAAIAATQSGTKRIAAAHALRTAFLNGHRLCVYQSGHLVISMDLDGNCTVVDNGTDVYFQPSDVIVTSTVKAGNLGEGEWWFELQGNTGFARFISGTVGTVESSAELRLPETLEPNQGIVVNFKLVMPRSLDGFI